MRRVSTPIVHAWPAHYVPAMKMTLLAVMIPMLASGMDRLVALSMIETGVDDYMVGSAGEISRYQILKSEWHSVTNSTRYADPATGRAVTLRLLEKRVQGFQSSFNRIPTDFELYALWNAPGQVMQRRVSRRVAERCQRFANLCAMPWPAMQTAQVSRRTTATLF